MSRKTNPRRPSGNYGRCRAGKARGTGRSYKLRDDHLLHSFSDKHAATDAELRQFWDEVNYLSESIVQGYVSLADLRHTLRTERGIEV